MTPSRLIASDLDGTLLRNDGTISHRTRNAIQAAAGAGVAFAFVTARQPRYVEGVAEAAGVAGLAVCSNGAILYDTRTSTELHRTDLAADVARQLVTVIRSTLPEVALALDHGQSFAYGPSFPVLREECASRVDDIEALLDGSLLKLLIHHPERNSDLLADLVKRAIGCLGEVNHSGSPEFIEIAAPGVSKATGLARLCDILNIDGSEVIAFGDMPNDLPMLRLAGIGVAMANAHPDLIAVADEITGSNEEDGVAQRIEALLDKLPGRRPRATNS